MGSPRGPRASGPDPRGRAALAAAGASYGARRALGILLLCGAAFGQEAPNLAVETPEAAKVSVERAIREGVRFLVEHQNADGSFGTRTAGRTWDVRAHVPGGHYAFQAATTAICWLGLHDVPHRTEESRRAQERALAWLVKHARVKRASPVEMYNTWALGYGLRALSVALRTKAPGAAPEEIRRTALALIAGMDLYQTPDGGFGYYDFRTKTYKPSWSTSFTTATALVGMHEAEAAGLAVPGKLVEKATRNVLMCRKPDGTYLYGTYHRYAPLHPVNKPQGASLRVQACNLGLFLHGAGGVDTGDLRAGLQMLRKHHRFAVAGVRRPIPHESWYAVSGYFYLYGHMYAATILERMPEADRERFWPFVVRATLKTRQPDGSFWDYPLYGYHKFYGTGYALMILGRCPPEIAEKLGP